MNKVFLIIIVTVLISTCGNCQWYQKRYGVNNIEQLSQQQLNDAFLRARGGARAGALLSAASAIGIVTGIIMFTYESPYAGDIGRNVGGVLLLAGTIPMEITGLIIWGISSERLQTVRLIMKNTEIRLGLLNYPVSNKPGGLNCYSIPGISVTFNF